MRIPLEWAAVRVKRASTIELSNLSQVAEVMTGQFVQKLSKGDLSQLRMSSCARTGRHWNAAQKNDGSAAEGENLLEVLGRSFPVHLGFQRGHVLCEGWRFLHKDAARTRFV